MKTPTKEYTNGELTVVWKPKLCIHAAECVKRLPKVYDPNARPWIQPENATTAELKAQIDACPSGALSYYMNNQTQEEVKVENTATKVDILPNGPLVVHGSIEIKGKDGNITTKENRTSFCRCGASNNKPYCDGTHRKIDFKG